MSINLLSKENDELKFHLEELQELLAPYANHKIAVVSIAGTYRTGKSFLINWLIKYVKSKSDWLAEGEKLDGFTFARQREPCTDGIDVWGEVRVNSHY